MSGDWRALLGCSLPSGRGTANCHGGAAGTKRVADRDAADCESSLPGVRQFDRLRGCGPRVLHLLRVWDDVEAGRDRTQAIPGLADEAARDTRTRSKSACVSWSSASAAQLQRKLEIASLGRSRPYSAPETRSPTHSRLPPKGLHWVKPASDGTSAALGSRRLATSMASRRLALRRLATSGRLSANRTQTHPTD